MTVDEIKDVVDKYNDLSEKVEQVIKDTCDEYITCVNGIWIDESGQNLDVSWTYTCRGCSDNDSNFIPVEWLQDGFDYKAAYHQMLKEKEERAKAEAERMKKEYAKKAEEEERKLFERLKKKFEGGGENDDQD